jgi:hypothetical protein
MENTSWTSITYGDQFVAVANAGPDNRRAMISPDGLIWTAIQTPTNAWTSITYGSGLYVAVANSGGNERVMTSSDAIHWTLRTAFQKDWRSVCFGNGLFVAVAQDAQGIAQNVIMTSSNGIVWTLLNTNISILIQLQSVYFQNNYFVAVGSGGAIFANALNITNWTVCSYSPSSTKNYVWSTITGNSSFNQMISFSPNAKIMISQNNGGGWSLLSNQYTYLTGDRISIIYANGLYVAVSNNGTYRAMTSNNGTSWSLRTVPLNSWTSVTFGLNGLFVAVANNGWNRVMVSDNGIDWVSIPLTTPSGNRDGEPPFPEPGTKYEPMLRDFYIPEKTTYNMPFAIEVPISNSDGNIYYTSSNHDVATIDGDIITIHGTGDSIIEANQEETNDFYSGSISSTLQVSNTIPTPISNGEEFVYFMNTSGTNGIIENSVQITDNLISSSEKTLLVKNSHIKILFI